MWLRLARVQGGFERSEGESTGLEDGQAVKGCGEGSRMTAGPPVWGGECSGGGSMATIRSAQEVVAPQELSPMTSLVNSLT